MGARGSNYFLVAILIAWPASAARAEDDKRTRPAAEQVQALQSEISDPADFKNFVEGSHRLPEGAAVPRAQLWPESAGQAAVKSALQSPALPSLRPERVAVPPAPDMADQSPAPVAGNLPKLPLAGLAIISLAAVGLLALGNTREFSSTPPAEAMPVEPAATVPAADALAPIPTPEVPITATPSARRLLARLEAPPEPFIDTRMPVSTWRAISWREQRLIERWDASPEKALGKASFEEWLDAQGRVEGVDVALLKTKLGRDV